MGELREELLKAGLIDKRAAETAQSKLRSTRRRKQNSGSSGRRVERTEEKNSRMEPSSRESDSSRFDNTTTDQEETARGLVSERIRSVSGNRRFYFVDRKGRIPFLELNESAVRGLTNGTLAIVEADDAEGEVHVVVAAATARRLESMNRDLVRFWNRPE